MKGDTNNKDTQMYYKKTIQKSKLYSINSLGNVLSLSLTIVKSKIDKAQHGKMMKLSISYAHNFWSEKVMWDFCSLNGKLNADLHIYLHYHEFLFLCNNLLLLFSFCGFNFPTRTTVCQHIPFHWFLHISFQFLSLYHLKSITIHLYIVFFCLFMK